MIKYKFWAVNVQKLENWLESYRQKGYQLKKINVVTGRHEFEKVETDFIPKVKIDFRSFKNNEQYKDYLTLFEDSGWKHIGGTKSNGIHYFQQCSADVQDDIFSDQESKAERYKRISNMWIELAMVYLPLLIAFQSAGIVDLSRMIHPADFYYTPRLWEMTGIQFWRAFLFETPFALGRAFGGILFLIIVLSYLFFGVKAWYWYKKEKE